MNIQLYIHLRTEIYWTVSAFLRHGTRYLRLCLAWTSLAFTTWLRLFANDWLVKKIGWSFRHCACALHYEVSQEVSLIFVGILVLFWMSVFVWVELCPVSVSKSYFWRAHVSDSHWVSMKSMFIMLKQRHIAISVFLARLFTIIVCFWRYRTFHLWVILVFQEYILLYWKIFIDINIYWFCLGICAISEINFFPSFAVSFIYWP